MTESSAETVFCTLFEGHYHYGVASLLNSLVHHGFRGTFLIGYRGALPQWMQRYQQANGEGAVVAGIRLRFEPFNTTWLLAHRKPQLILDIFERIAPEAERVYYADPDVVIDCEWTFFERWVDSGVALCEDCNFASLPFHHYLRRAWKQYAEERLGLVVDDSMQSGFNSGFIGVRREHIPFIETWRDALHGLEAEGVPLDLMKPGTRFDSFFGTDQDTLNIATMVHAELVSSLGTQGMGFTYGMTPMWHAVEAVKPWRERYLLSWILRARRISGAQKRFWRYTTGPIQLYSPLKRTLHLIDLYLAVALSRLYRTQ